MPQHKRGPWSQTEDQYLLHLVNLHGAHNWVRISSTIQTRSPKQCRERFHQNLKPNLNHDPITPEEGVMIEQMVSEMGKRWAEIARRLRGRSDNAVKNWWNGGMNRRRRSNNPRRTELEVRQQPQTLPPPPPSTHHHYLQSNFSQPSMAPQQYFGQPIYQVPHMHSSQQVSVPSNAPAYRYSGLIETPLPSPSAFSQLSVDGAPSLVSDCSSVSGRSPHHGTSPIELPPLSGTHNDRRHSSGSALRLSVPGSYVPENNDFQNAAMGFKQQQSHMLQEPFVPQQPQYFPQPTHFLPSQPRQLSPMQMPPVPMPQGFNMLPNEMRRGNVYPQQSQSQLPSTPASALQLPSISHLSVSGHGYHGSGSGMSIDPALDGQHPSPVGSMATPDASPREKMSLSNLTH